MSSGRPHISAVSPVFQAEDCVPELYRRLSGALGSISDNFEIILVEDCGDDSSWNLITKIAEKDSRVKGIKLGRNFGQHYAITAGLDIAEGDWVVILDCDLQDPPEAIPKLYAKAQEGFDVVEAAFVNRDSDYSGFRSWFFWKTLRFLSNMKFDHKIGNFRIISRKVLINFKSYREQLRFLGGILLLMGFDTARIPIAREPRFAGKTSYSFLRMISASVDIIIAYSDRPLKLSIVFGFIISILSLLFGIYVFILHMLGITGISGWPSLIISVYFIGGIIITNLGLLGIYVGRIFEETKNRPLYIIDKTTFNTNDVES